MPGHRAMPVVARGPFASAHAQRRAAAPDEHRAVKRELAHHLHNRIAWRRIEASALEKAFRRRRLLAVMARMPSRQPSASVSFVMKFSSLD